MRTITMVLAASLAAAAGLAAGCGEKEGGATTGAPTPSAAAPAESAKIAASAKPVESAPPAAESAAVPAATGSAAPAESAHAAGSAAAPHPTGSAAAGGKTFDCGAKGQKNCPMQGWMKTVMASASSSGDGAKLGQALDYVAAHVPPGYGNWAQMAKDGSAKAKAGDVEGAKASCKTCHDAYKEKYKTTMRDRPF